ncbi:hypothetical protein ACWMSZ_004173 [Yersinia enterocolitica]
MNTICIFTPSKRNLDAADRNYSPRQSGRQAAYLTLMGFVPAEMRGTKEKLALDWQHGIS